MIWWQIGLCGRVLRPWVLLWAFGAAGEEDGGGGERGENFRDEPGDLHLLDYDSEQPIRNFPVQFAF
jgi:hypothetical protein